MTKLTLSKLNGEAKISLVKSLTNQQKFYSLNELTKDLENKLENYSTKPITNKVTSSDNVSFKDLLTMSVPNSISLYNENIDNFNNTLEQMVPDENFASVLNNNLEVMVENTIYKVTPYGTFAVDPSNYQ